MPYKLKEPYRHKFPTAKYRVTNWSEYDRGLVQRGDLRFWIDEEVIADWQAPRRKIPGGQETYSNSAIVATLTLRAVSRLRQNEGFVRGLFSLMGVGVPIPDHTTLSRRRRTVEVDMHARPTDIVLDSTGLKFYGPGEWDRKKHGERRRASRKLHISVDPATSESVAHELTDSDTSDGAMAGPLVAGSGGNIRRVIADGAYDGATLPAERLFILHTTNHYAFEPNPVSMACGFALRFHGCMNSRQGMKLNSARASNWLEIRAPKRPEIQAPLTHLDNQQADSELSSDPSCRWRKLR